jgi:ribosomal protein S18 acetylase RimI-like enzyme
VLWQADLVERHESDWAIGWYDGPRDALRPLFELAEDSPRQLEEYIDRGRVLVARDEDGHVVGHLQLVETDIAGMAEIKNVAVDPRCQRRGVGRALVEHALTSCRSTSAAASGRPRSSTTPSRRRTAIHPGSRATGSPFATRSASRSS